MKYFSTRSPGRNVSFQEALFQGLSPDGGLYMPEQIPRLETSFFSAIGAVDRSELFYELGKALFGSDIPPSTLQLLLDKALDFPIPLLLSDDPQYPHLLELFHGPTFAFKDVGARVMAQFMQFFNDRPRLIITATSGDTGAAIAAAFSGLTDFRVVILYPKGKISAFQEKQLFCWEENILPVAVEGSFDDCQSLAKEAFLDVSAPWHAQLASANSINVGRLLPQVFYYFEAYRQLKPTHEQLVFSVPCGNLGSLTAGIIAQRMGLPVQGFLAANNQNHVFSDFLKSGVFSPQAAIATLANAMDVGNPSNFERIKYLLGSTWNKDDVWIKGQYFSDAQIVDALNEIVPPSMRASVCPHTATAFLFAMEFLKKRASLAEVPVVVLGTAHPGKFVEPMVAGGVRMVEGGWFLSGNELGENGAGPAVVVKAEYGELKACLMNQRGL